MNSIWHVRNLICLLCLFTSADTTAQSWEFIKERDRIKMYTRKEHGGPFKSFKGVMEIRSTMEMIATVVGNVKNFDWWDDDIRELKVLGHMDNVYSQYYLIYDVPWPLQDRDLCVDARITIDSVSGKKIIHATPLLGVIPEEPDMVRITNYWQRWTIEPLEHGRIRLTLEGFVDPGGIVPSWLYNMVITDTPLNLMREVKKRVEIW
ncbi:MAG: START domain-containing protein [bacterium]